MTPSPQKAIILIVDDEHPVRAVISVYCRLAGYESIQAEDGIQALLATETTAFDLIITDYRMPLMDGLEFCRRLRLSVQKQAIPVIMCTASILELDIFALEQELAPISFVKKPFQPQYLPKIQHTGGWKTGH